MAKPRRVKINGDWYEANEWMSKLEFFKYGSPAKYTAQEPFVHMSNFYYVYDSSGNKIGEFNTDNRTYSGCVNGFEMWTGLIGW